MGLQPGDEIVKINGARVETFTEVQFELSRYKGGSVDVEYLRNGETHNVSVVPKQDKDGRYIIGFENDIARKDTNKQLVIV